MRELFQSVRNQLSRNSDGATAVEYGLLLSLMVLALLCALGATGDRTEEKWDGVAANIVNATGTSN